MIRYVMLIAMALDLTGCNADRVSEPVAQAAIGDGKVAGGTCRAMVFEGSEFTTCTAVPGEQNVDTELNDNNGMPVRTLARLANDNANKKSPVMFAMNAGMFDEEGKPIGYYVENGKRLKKLNQNQGGGNFHLLPNGVFFGSGDRWQIRTAQDFADTVTKRPDFATQSGPMLVIGGAFHPQISANGQSLNIRNAVGIDRQGRALFVISEVPVSFGRLARLMRDRLHCANALYLDGTVSSLWYPAGDRLDTGYPIGPIVVVKTTKKAAS
jgi:uncharacterized protein YigE (DUF2233 family)